MSCNFKGATGPQGPVGATGAQGPAGCSIMGATGPRGLTGPSGPGGGGGGDLTNPMLACDDLIVGGPDGSPGRLEAGALGEHLAVEPEEVPFFTSVPQEDASGLYFFFSPRLCRVPALQVRLDGVVVDPTRYEIGTSVDVFGPAEWATLQYLDAPSPAYVDATTPWGAYDGGGLSATRGNPGTRVSHNGVNYECIQEHSNYPTPLHEPGVAADWEDYWVVVGWDMITFPAGITGEVGAPGTVTLHDVHVGWNPAEGNPMTAQNDLIAGGIGGVMTRLPLPANPADLVLNYGPHMAAGPGDITADGTTGPFTVTAHYVTPLLSYDDGDTAVVVAGTSGNSDAFAAGYAAWSSTAPAGGYQIGDIVYLLTEGTTPYVTYTCVKAHTLAHDPATETAYWVRGPYDEVTLADAVTNGTAIHVGYYGLGWAEINPPAGSAGDMLVRGAGGAWGILGIGNLHDVLTINGDWVVVWAALPPNPV